MKQRVPSAIYNKAFREQAVKQVTEEGLSPKEAAWRLSMPVPTLEYWLKAAKFRRAGITLGLDVRHRNRHVWNICLLSHLSANSMKIGWWYEPVGVHY